MQRAFKNPTSTIVMEGWQYNSGNAHNNGKIVAILCSEQKNFCAYTDELMSRTDAKDVEHFNPQLKGTQTDGYHNWFAVKHQWNLEKNSKWANFQPVLHPTAEDFEERIVYDGGDYRAGQPSDMEAINLIKLLQLDDADLAKKRKKYIARKKTEIAISGQSAIEFFRVLAAADPCQLHYPRAIKEVFGVDVLAML